MVLTFAAVSLIVLALSLLAIRYGSDSRNGFFSKEEQLAAFGVTWDELSDQQGVAVLAHERRANLLAEGRRLARTGRVGQRTPLRITLARRLRALADRIDVPPQTARSAHA